MRFASDRTARHEALGSGKRFDSGDPMAGPVGTHLLGLHLHVALGGLVAHLVHEPGHRLQDGQHGLQRRWGQATCSVPVAAHGTPFQSTCLPPLQRVSAREPATLQGRNGGGGCSQRQKVEDRRLQKSAKVANKDALAKSNRNAKKPFKS